METTQVTGASTYSPGLSYRLQHSKALVAIVAVLGVTVMALAAALVVNHSSAQPGGTAAAPVAAVAGVTPAPAPKGAADAPKAVHNTAPKPSSVPTVVAKSSHASVCADCGTVEAVTAVKRQGQVNGVAVGNTTIGLGTVAGGLIGGLLGHEVGNGNGKTAATVLGAAGGAFAGNAIEKNMKTVTVYDVRVRMADGSIRNLDISTAPAVGSKVIVEGKNLRMATTNG